MQGYATVKEHGYGVHHGGTTAERQRVCRERNYSQIKQARGLKFVYQTRVGSYRIMMKSKDFLVTLASTPHSINH